MNRLKKKITVSFFSITATDAFFRSFISSFVATRDGTKSSRVFNLREKKHLIKVSQECNVSKNIAYAVTVVRERNTWQTKATSDGKIAGITLNQGIIGDPYFFFVVPEQKILLGFTSGPSGSLKSVAKIVLEQFNTDRSQEISLDFIPKEKEYSALESLPSSGEMNLKVDSSSLSDVFEGAPQLIKDMSSSPFLGHNVQLVLNLQFADTTEAVMSKDGVVELVNYFADHEGCLALKIKGVGDDGNNVRLDFGDAFFNYRTEISTRNTFIEEKHSLQVLEEALKTYLDDVALSP